MTTPRRAHDYCLVLMLLVANLLRQRHRAAAKSPPVGEAEAEAEAVLLLQIKRTWDDPPVLAVWNTTTASAAGAHCHWPYVRCDLTGRVTSLVLSNTNVMGPISNAVGGLSNLISLDVSYNTIFSVFPTALYRCRSLRYLDLSYNDMGGELPDDIRYNLGANLSKLNLEGNKFNGTIPTSLSMLRNLRYLGLDSNSFTGTVPVQLGELTSLRELWLSNNLLDAGELLASFENLTNLVSLSASSCSLTGDFPSYVVKMSKLKWLDLSYNSLTGSIPVGVWRLRNLQNLFVDNNNLTGNLMIDGFAAMGLIAFYASNNNFTGVIPEVFGHLENLLELILSNNRLSGAIPEGLCDCVPEASSWRRSTPQATT